ncbi:MAG: hypothetical protein WA418_06120 [Bradyrhizobium sp.]
MNAELVWDTWRRVLRDDALVRWVKQPDARTDDLDGLSAEEKAIVADYASTPAATDSNIGMYRRGLVRNALGALDLVPLTRRLLHQSGREVEAVAEDFVKSAGYPDDGPNFWRNAERFVAYLARLPEFASPAHQDVLAIDEATIALARRLGRTAPAVWPLDAARHAAVAGRSEDRSARVCRNPAAVVLSSSRDLTAWIEDPLGFDPADDLDISQRYWLVYVPAAELAHEYAELSERGARAFGLLDVPRTVDELLLQMGGLSLADVQDLLGALMELGVVMSGPDLLALAPASGNVLTMDGSADRSTQSRIGQVRQSHETA